MEISVYQIHNVLRTYNHLIKEMPDHAVKARESKLAARPPKGPVPAQDKITLSNPSRAQPIKDEPTTQDKPLEALNEE